MILVKDIKVGNYYKIGENIYKCLVNTEFGYKEDRTHGLLFYNTTLHSLTTKHYSSNYQLNIIEFEPPFKEYILEWETSSQEI